MPAASISNGFTGRMRKPSDKRKRKFLALVMRIK